MGWVSDGADWDGDVFNHKETGWVMKVELLLLIFRFDPAAYIVLERQKHESPKRHLFAFSFFSKCNHNDTLFSVLGKLNSKKYLFSGAKY